MDIADLHTLFNRPGRVVTLSTRDAAGNLNAALFGSARLTAEGRVILGLGANRTLANLREHPQAVLLFADPGPSLPAWQGARLYLEVEEIAGDGPLFTELVAQVAANAGRRAARSLRVAVTFRITAVRPLLDRPALGD